MRDLDIEGLCKYRYLMDINLKKTYLVCYFSYL